MQPYKMAFYNHLHWMRMPAMKLIARLALPAHAAVQKGFL
jgi:hypothetical protein